MSIKCVICKREIEKVRVREREMKKVISLSLIFFFISSFESTYEYNRIKLQIIRRRTVNNERNKSAKFHFGFKKEGKNHDRHNHINEYSIIYFLFYFNMKEKKRKKKECYVKFS